MKKQSFGIQVENEIVLLGTGTSVGVPTLGCGCDVCRSDDPHNRRTRCSALVGLPGGHLLIDTPPDLRHQLLRERVGLVHAVAYTHEHADHIFGLDDLRVFPFYLGSPVPIYCSAVVEQCLRQAFHYAFDAQAQTHPGAVPNLDLRRISQEPFDVLGETILPIQLRHGPRFQVLGFRIRDFAYCTDTNQIPPESWAQLQGLDTLVLDALRPAPHPTHFCLEEAVEVARSLGPRMTYFTHISCRMDHASTNAQLPPGMRLGYDGLRIPLR